MEHKGLLFLFKKVNIVGQIRTNIDGATGYAGDAKPYAPVNFNPFESRGNSATSNNMKLVHWPLMGGLLHLIQRGGDLAHVLS